MSNSAPSPDTLLPHAAPMVLIDAILHWDDNNISCTADSHLAADNPLRQSGVLSVYTGIEYAAQAMAAHAQLTSMAATSVPRKGFLATASKLSAQVRNLDDVAEPLLVELQMIAVNSGSSLYSFVISAGGQILLDGQLMAVVE
jgi:predicted hotdog family 3-hydroxylacyl-ACP dehydratase